MWLKTAEQAHHAARTRLDNPYLHATCSADGRHALTAEALVRKLTDSSHHASPAVRRLLGEQLKPALAYAYRRSALDDAAYPTRGWAFRCTGDNSLGANMPRNV